MRCKCVGPTIPDRPKLSCDSSTLTGNLSDAPRLKGNDLQEAEMDGIVYLVGLIVIIMFILSLFGLR
jgi:hypothetical protein